MGLGPLLFFAAPLRRISSTFIPPSFYASEEFSNHSQWPSSFQSHCFNLPVHFFLHVQQCIIKEDTELILSSFVTEGNIQTYLVEGDFCIPIYWSLTRSRKLFACGGQRRRFEAIAGRRSFRRNSVVTKIFKYLPIILYNLIASFIDVP